MSNRGLILLCILLIVLLPACQQPAPAPAPAPAPSPAQTSSPQAKSSPPVTPPVSAPPSSQPGPGSSSLDHTWAADGVISEGEYTGNKTYGDYHISWSNDDIYVYVGIKAKTTGWVAVGFGAGSMMKNADIVEGYVSNGKAELVDMFSTGEFGPHPPDTQLGGSNDIIDPSAKVVDGYITVEFKRKLNTDDKYDRPLVKGSNKIIWAYSSEPIATLKHVSRGLGEIDIQ